MLNCSMRLLVDNFNIKTQNIVYFQTQAIKIGLYIKVVFEAGAELLYLLQFTKNAREIGFL